MITVKTDSHTWQSGFGVNPSAVYPAGMLSGRRPADGGGGPDTSPLVTGSSLCVVMVCVGSRAAQGLEVLSVPMARSYARMCCADFRVITDLGEGDKYQHPKYAIMAVGELFNEYERILIVDADALIRPSAPDVFQTFPPGTFYAHNEAAVKGEVWARQYHDRMNQDCGTDLKYEGVHFNGGVQLADREHRELYAMPPWDVTSPENLWFSSRVVKNQPWFNHRRMALGIPFGEMGAEWNCLMSAWDSYPDLRRRSHIWHYATASHLDKEICMRERLAQEALDPRRVCVVTVAVGDGARDVGRVSVPTLQAYAERCGYDFMMMRTTGNHVSPAWTRFDAVRLLGSGGYDLVVYVDNDIIVKGDAPPLGWFLRGEWDFAAFDSGTLGYMRKSAVREVTAYCGAVGIPVPGGYDGTAYPNSGVLVFRNTEAMRNWRPREAMVGWQDQNAVAYAAIVGDLSWLPLGREWNFGHMNRVENRVDALGPCAHFVHFNGIPYGRGRLEAMRQWKAEYDMRRKADA